MTADRLPRIDDAPKCLSQRAHRRLIGFLGLVLPALLYLWAALFRTDGLAPWDVMDSVSEYYYTGASGIFVGVLFALSLFLFTYPGYPDTKADRIIGCLGGTAALGVALFPTSAPEKLYEPTWWSEPLGVVHYVCAIVLFIVFIIFSIWLFRLSDIQKRRERSVEKRRRDSICLVCGVVMIVCVLWAATSLITGAAIFWPESIAIAAFAVSWLTKGEIHQPVLRWVRHVRSSP